MTITLKRVKQSIVKFLIVGAIGGFVPSLVYAQGASDNQDIPTISSSTLQATSTSLDLLAILAPLVTSLAGLTAQSTVQAQNAQRYVDQNAVALAQDVHIGSGATLHDVYKLLDIPRVLYPRLNRTIRQKRLAYAKFLGPKPRGGAFVKAIREDVDALTASRQGSSQ